MNKLRKIKYIKIQFNIDNFNLLLLSLINLLILLNKLGSNN